MWNVQIVVHLAQICDQICHFFIGRSTAESHEISDIAITLFRGFVFGVKGNYFWKIHGIGGTMDNMCAIIGESSSGFVSHRVYDSKQGIAECHTGETLCIVHRITFCHVAIVRIYQIVLDHFYRMKGKWVREITVCGRNISFNRMCHCIHTGVSDKFLRHRLGKVRVYDSNIRRNLKVSDRILDSFFIIGND